MRFITLLLTSYVILSSHFEMKTVSSNELNFSEWMYVLSDKPLQYQMAKIRQEGNIGYFKIRIRFNEKEKFECGSKCYGYHWQLSWRSDDRQKENKINITYSSKYKEPYFEIPMEIPLQLGVFADGSKRKWDENTLTLMISLRNTDQYEYYCFFDSCFSWYEQGGYNKCFDIEEEVIRLQ